MPFVTKQKLNLLDFAAHQNHQPTVLIAAVEPTLAAIYSDHLRRHRLRPHYLQHLHNLGSYIDFFGPRVLVGGVESGKTFSNTLKAIREIRQAFPSLPIVSLGFSLENDEMGKLMETGVTSHINRRFTRPADVVAVVKNVIVG